MDHNTIRIYLTERQTKRFDSACRRIYRLAISICDASHLPVDLMTHEGDYLHTVFPDDTLAMLTNEAHLYVAGAK